MTSSVPVTRTVALASSSTNGSLGSGEDDVIALANSTEDALREERLRCDLSRQPQEGSTATRQVVRESSPEPRAPSPEPRAQNPEPRAQFVAVHARPPATNRGAAIAVERLHVVDWRQLDRRHGARERLHDLGVELRTGAPPQLPSASAPCAPGGRRARW